MSEVKVFISGFAFITTSADATSDVQLFNVAVTLYVPLSLTSVRVFDAPVPLPAPDHANVAPDWSLDAVRTTSSPSHTSDDVGVISALGIGLIVIVAEPLTCSFLQLPSSLTDFTVYVYSPTTVGVFTSNVFELERLLVDVAAPPSFLSSQYTRNLGSPVIVNVTGVLSVSP